MERSQEPPKVLVMNLTVGGDPLNPLEAFKWDATEIIEWTKSVVERANKKPVSKAPKPDDKTKPEPSVGGDGNDPPLPRVTLKKEQIERIRDMQLFIENFKLEGPDYLGTKNAWGPAHHFSRKLDHKSMKRRFDFNDVVWVNLEFRNLYDVLGAFLMVVGIVQTTSTRGNFFAPLTAMYAKWCSKLGGHPDDVEPKNTWKELPGKWPAVYQCTWLTPGTKRRKVHPGFEFCLGASFGGCDFISSDDGVGADWHNRLLNKRLDMLRAARAFNPKPGKEEKDPDPKTLVPWGNCAEAYPFATMFREVPTLKDVNLLALTRSFFEGPEFYDQQVIRKSAIGPCDNCRYMLKFRDDIKLL